MKWEKTTFGELKAGDVFNTRAPSDHDGYDVVFLRLATPANVEEDWAGNHREVYRLVTPEREAFEKTCAGRTPEQIAEALRLLDNREAIREKLEMLSERCKHLSSPEPKIIEAALALLEKGGEG